MACVDRITFVGDELFLDLVVCVDRSGYRGRIDCEFGIAAFTDGEHRDIVLSLDDPELAFRHALSLPQSGRDCYRVEMQPAPLPLLEIVVATLPVQANCGV